MLEDGRIGSRTSSALGPPRRGTSGALGHPRGLRALRPGLGGRRDDPGSGWRLTTGTRPTTPSGSSTSARSPLRSRAVHRRGDLQGRKKPHQCPAFRCDSTPDTARRNGLSEGACAAYHRYARPNREGPVCPRPLAKGRRDARARRGGSSRSSDRGSLPPRLLESGLAPLHDGAASSFRRTVAFTTDSYVVRPPFFGRGHRSLAVHAPSTTWRCAARPVALSAGSSSRRVPDGGPATRRRFH